MHITANGFSLRNLEEFRVVRCHQFEFLVGRQNDYIRKFGSSGGYADDLEFNEIGTNARQTPPPTLSIRWLEVGEV
ncbi:hypothetical protein N9189_02955 [Pirellulaceae bacterium]|nr:hypothetical protein [Pirellulaceae bacterium]